MSDPRNDSLHDGGSEHGSSEDRTYEDSAHEDSAHEDGAYEDHGLSDDVPATPNPFAVGFSEPTSGVVEIEDDLGPDLVDDTDDFDEDDDDPLLDRPDRGDVELNEGDLDVAVNVDDDPGLDDDSELDDDDDFVLDEDDDDDEVDDDFDDAELDAVSDPYELGTHRVVTDPDAGSYTDIDVDPDDDNELER